MLARTNEFGVSMIYMLSFVRQYVIACNFKDGGQDPATLTPREAAHALKEVPNFFDYLNYMFFS
jgi:hypothetical protein